ncbi:hypothetical protein [Paenibacillus polymyxa]|uniref:hypothetical protein n=1 Tax=Paenibacillus polymyxa TaxID=1406 RepID=UPI002AB4044C|nr:hypothetical protein [Paenibacillus polymyxa]MDY8022803.1 hypothetical protein [Paenibacillus polymyxa]
MSVFWNSIVGSTSLVNSATIISLILAVIFFAYQEHRSRREHAKEILRLRDEITNLIIRNHVSNGVPVSRIDLQVVIDGFESIKSCSLKLSTVEVIEMIYAKVYENEHIGNSMRVELLKELEDILSSYSIGLLENQPNSDRDIIITPRMSVIISLPVLVSIMALGIFLSYTMDLNTIFVNVLMLTLLFLYLYAMPAVHSLLEKFINGEARIAENGQLSKKILQINQSEINLSKFDESEEVTFEQLFDNKEDIYEVFGQRVILEKLLRNLYLEVFQEETKFSVSKIISLLARENILNENLTYPLKRAYQYSSFVIHEGKLPPEIKSYKELIDYLKGMTILTNQIIESLKNK